MGRPSASRRAVLHIARRNAMATTRLTPIHIGKGRSVAKVLKESVDYFENPLKTDNGEWTSSYESDVRTADAEFLLAKKYA